MSNLEDESIDAVILYLDATDLDWQKGFAQATNQPGVENNCRYRNWDNLQYIFRGIERNMSWVRRVHLVVQSESQLPKWLNRDSEKLRVVYHTDYIPPELLPTFNSNVIELFLHRIPDIAPRFIYFNDDMFPIAPLRIDNFFDGFKSRIRQRKGCWRGSGQYEKMLANNIAFLRRFYPKHRGFYPEHTAYNILTSVMQSLIESELPAIMERLRGSQVRNDKNLTIQAVIDFMILSKRASLPKIRSKFQNLYDGLSLQFPSEQLICYNDTEGLNRDYPKLKTLVNSMLQALLPRQSAFER